MPAGADPRQALCGRGAHRDEVRIAGTLEGLEPVVGDGEGLAPEGQAPVTLFAGRPGHGCAGSRTGRASSGDGAMRWPARRCGAVADGQRQRTAVRASTRSSAVAWRSDPPPRSPGSTMIFSTASGTTSRCCSIVNVDQSRCRFSTSGSSTSSSTCRSPRRSWRAASPSPRRIAVGQQSGTPVLRHLFELGVHRHRVNHPACPATCGVPASPSTSPSDLLKEALHDVRLDLVALDPGAALLAGPFGHAGAPVTAFAAAAHRASAAAAFHPAGEEPLLTRRSTQLGSTGVGEDADQLVVRVLVDDRRPVPSHLDGRRLTLAGAVHAFDETEPGDRRRHQQPPHFGDLHVAAGVGDDAAAAITLLVSRNTLTASRTTSASSSSISPEVRRPRRLAAVPVAARPGGGAPFFIRC